MVLSHVVCSLWYVEFLLYWGPLFLYPTADVTDRAPVHYTAAAAVTATTVTAKWCLFQAGEINGPFEPFVESTRRRWPFWLILVLMLMLILMVYAVGA